MTASQSVRSPLGSLDYVYAPSSDVAADARWFQEVFGAQLIFAIDDGGTKVASLQVGESGPPMLLTDHLPDDRPVFVYRVADLDAAGADLRVVAGRRSEASSCRWVPRRPSGHQAACALRSTRRPGRSWSTGSRGGAISERLST